MSKITTRAEERQKIIGEDFWEKVAAKSYDVLRELSYYQEMLDKASDSLDVQEGEKYLDAGCGTGNMSERILEEGGRVYALDNSESMLRQANKKLKDYDGWEAELKDVNKGLEVPDNSFDGISSLNTVYLFDDPQGFMNDCYRALKEEGTAVFSGPREDSNFLPLVKQGLKDFGTDLLKPSHLTPLVAQLVAQSRLNMSRRYENSHFNLFSEDDWRGLLEEAGFSDIEVDNIYLDQAHIVKGEKK